MYVRFVSPQPMEDRPGYYGIFYAALEIVYDEETPYHVYLPIRELLNWYNENLPQPEANRFLVRSRKRYLSDGICWFHDDAHEMIGRAFVLAGLLRDCGVNISKLATDRPGQILYRDAYQIVAKPEAETPVEWC
ncbi:MAG: hypothetical protein AAGE37_03600 [Pseudomonadota bacterium]